MHDDDTDPAADRPLPCFNALMVGTFALMTRWAATPEGARAGNSPHAAELRPLLARKIVSNLFFMGHHPACAGPVAQALARAHADWVAIAATPAGAAAPPPPCEPRPADAVLH